MRGADVENQDTVNRDSIPRLHVVLDDVRPVFNGFSVTDAATECVQSFDVIWNVPWAGIPPGSVEA